MAVKAFTKDDVEQARKNILNQRKFKKELVERLNVSTELSFEEKATIAYQLNPQSFGTLIEAIAKDMGGFKKIDSTLNCGDLTKNNKVYEFKSGMFDSKGDTNIPQCREYQELDYYHLYKYNPIDDEHFHFIIPKQVITDISLRIKSLSHGTIESNNNNENVEKSIRMSINPNHKTSYEVYKAFLPYRFKSFTDAVKARP